MRRKVGPRGDSAQLQQGSSEEERLVTPHPSCVRTSQGSFVAWFPLAALGILQRSHAAICNCTAQDHVLRLNRSDFGISPHYLIPIPISPRETAQADCEFMCTTSFVSTRADPE